MAGYMGADLDDVMILMYTIGQGGSDWQGNCIAADLELLWQVERNSVVLLRAGEVLVWLDKCDDRRSHADLLVVHIVA